MFRKSKKLGVRYVTYDPKRPPTFDGEAVSVYHMRMGREMITPVDLLVLSTPLIAQDDASEISPC